MFRIPLILGVFVALICAGIGTAADGPAGRPDGRHLPDGADIQRTTPASRPDDRGDRFTPGASSEPAVITGRPDGRTVPDAVDARNTVTPAVIVREWHDLVRLVRGADRRSDGRRSGTRNGRSARSPPPRAYPRSLTVLRLRSHEGRPTGRPSSSSSPRAFEGHTRPPKSARLSQKRLGNGPLDISAARPMMTRSAAWPFGCARGAYDAPDGDGCFDGVAVLVEADVAEDAVLDSRLEQLLGD